MSRERKPYPGVTMPLTTQGVTQQDIIGYGLACAEKAAAGAMKLREEERELEAAEAKRNMERAVRVSLWLTDRDDREADEDEPRERVVRMSVELVEEVFS